MICATSCSKSLGQQGSARTGGVSLEISSRAAVVFDRVCSSSSGSGMCNGTICGIICDDQGGSGSGDGSRSSSRRNTRRGREG